MSKFKNGEVAEIAGLLLDTHNNGEECTVIEFLGTEYFPRRGLSRLAYNVKKLDGIVKFIAEINLRKKRPPAENQDIVRTRKEGTGDWDLMPWRPEPVKELEEVERPGITAHAHTWRTT